MKEFKPIFVFLLTMNFILVNAGEILKIIGAGAIGTATGLTALYYYKKADYFNEMAKRDLKQEKDNLQEQYNGIPIDNIVPEGSVENLIDNNVNNEHLANLQNIYSKLKEISKTRNFSFLFRAYPDGDAILLHGNVVETRQAIDKLLVQELPNPGDFRIDMNKASKDKWTWLNFTLVPISYLVYKIIYYFQQKN